MDFLGSFHPNGPAWKDGYKNVALIQTSTTLAVEYNFYRQPVKRNRLTRLKNHVFLHAVLETANENHNSTSVEIIWNWIFLSFSNDLVWKYYQNESCRSQKVMKLYSWEVFHLKSFCHRKLRLNFSNLKFKFCKWPRMEKLPIQKL